MSQPALPLYAYQHRWFKDRSRFKLGQFARQTGKTFTTTLEIVDDTLEAEAKSIRSPWNILSRGERQAREAMEEGVFRHLEAYGRSLKRLGLEEIEFYDEESGLKRKALQVIISKLNKITALPSTPDTARGFSSNLYLDEFAFHKDSRKIWAAAFPIVSAAGYKLRVTSTSNGKNNKFFDLATGKDDGWSRHMVDIHQAVAEGCPRNIEELKAALNDDDIWDQEFLLKWLDEASAWISYDLINSVEHDHAGIPEHYQGGVCFGGEDIGRRRDLWVCWIGEMIGDVLWEREMRVEKRISFAAQDAIRNEMFAKYRIGRYCMDQTGMGEKPVEDAQRAHGASRVEGVLFTSPNKLHLATVGKEAFEDRRIRIRMGDQAYRSDLHALKKIPSATGGAPRFDADANENGHADRAWATFLACHAADRPFVKPEYHGAPGRHAPVGGGGKDSDFDDNRRRRFA